MGQRGDRPSRRHFVALLATATLLYATGCERPAAGPTSATPSTQPARKHPTVASLSPAATDIVVAIGAQDHLVAVSNYDQGKPAVAGLPGTGDYLTVDWERLAELKPDVLVMQVREEHAPAGFKQNAASIGIRPVYIHIDKLADISRSTMTLGEAINEPAKAAAAERAMRQKLDAVSKSVAGKPRVKTLVVTDEVGAGAAGTGTFLDELLTIAGGDNAAAGEGAGYPGLDREKVVSLKPEAVLHLLPDKPTRVVEDAKRYWATMPDVPAVKNGRVYYLTESSVMHPGLGVGDVAKLFAEKLHGESPRSFVPIDSISPHAGVERSAAPDFVFVGNSSGAARVRSAPACGWSAAIRNCKVGFFLSQVSP